MIEGRLEELKNKLWELADYVNSEYTSDSELAEKLSEITTLFQDIYDDVVV